MDRLIRLLNVIRKRKLGIWVGAIVGAMVFLAVPMTFSFLYSSLISWESAHVKGILAIGLNVLTFVGMILLAITIFTVLRIMIAQLFRCRWYRSR